MTVHLYPTPSTHFPVFILLIGADDTPVTSTYAEDAIVQLLKNASAPDIEVIHGVCVCTRSQAAFYQVKQQDVLPKPQGQVHFDLDLAEESGAKHFVEVVEHIQQMCQEFVLPLSI